MNSVKQLVFRYFDMVLKGYEKHGRRAINMRAPHVLLEYMNGDGRVVFDYDTSTEIINFNGDDFGIVKNMFSLTIPELVSICKEYVADKFGKPNLLTTLLYIQELNY
jgi:hypothetical protein